MPETKRVERPVSLNPELTEIVIDQMYHALKVAHPRLRLENDVEGPLLIAEKGKLTVNQPGRVRIDYENKIGRGYDFNEKFQGISEREHYGRDLIRFNQQSEEDGSEQLLDHGTVGDRHGYIITDC